MDDIFPKSMTGRKWKALYDELNRCKWCRSKAAKNLEMGLRTVTEMIRDMRLHGFNIPDSPFGTVPGRYKNTIDWSEDWDDLNK